MFYDREIYQVPILKMPLLNKNAFYIIPFQKCFTTLGFKNVSENFKLIYGQRNISSCVSIYNYMFQWLFRSLALTDVPDVNTIDVNAWFCKVWFMITPWRWHLVMIAARSFINFILAISKRKFPIIRPSLLQIKNNHIASKHFLTIKMTFTMPQLFNNL